eukprot:1284082-Prymnesium_polylepis.1
MKLQATCTNKAFKLTGTGFYSVAGLAHGAMRLCARVASRTTNKTLGSCKTPPALKLVLAPLAGGEREGLAGLEK